MAQSITETLSARSTNDMHRRNVVVLGKTGAGKSSVASKIIEADDEDEGTRFNISHDVQNFKKESKAELSLLTTTDNICYIVQVVDTIGLFDADTKSKDSLSNQRILRDVQLFLRQRVPEGLNLIIYVFKEGRWSQEEHEAFELFTRHFTNSEISEISALVMTHCEVMMDEKKRELVEEFKKSHKNVAEFMKKGIYAVGFPNLLSLHEVLRDIFEETQKKDQEVLRQLVYSADEMKDSNSILPTQASDAWCTIQ